MAKRWTLVAPALLVPLVLVGVLARRSDDASERWRRMEAWAEAAERSWERRSFDREPAWGEGTAGAAFGAYAQAIRRSAQMGESDRELGRRLRLAPEEVPPQEAQAFARRWAPALADLSRGAHLQDARPPVEWDAGFASETARFLVLRDLANAALVEVRSLLAQGRPLAAVELALDAATFATDLLQSPILIDQMVACALVAITTGETWRDEDLRRLDAEALEQLDLGLAALDERCPRGADWRGEALLLANELSGVGGGNASERLLAADAVLRQVELWKELESGADDPWPERERALSEAMSAEQPHENPALQVTMASWTSVERSLRSSATIVRLLRVAVAHHRGAPLPELRDPLGADALAVEPDPEGGFHVRSAGWPEQRSLERRVAPRS